MKRRILAVLLFAVALAVGVGAMTTSAKVVPHRSNSPFHTVAISKGSKFHVGITLVAPTRWRGKHIKRYQWERCNVSGRRCAAIRGATHRRYKLTRRDIGHTIVIRMVVGNTIVSSTPTGVVTPSLPVNTVLPTITDKSSGSTSSVTVGDVLNGGLGTWTGAVSYTWAWQHCVASACTTVASGGPVTDATTVPTYTVATGDIGDTIQLLVTAFNTKQ